MSPSEHRLHPIALLLLVGKQLRELGFAVLAILVVTRTGSNSAGAIGQAVGPIIGVLVLLGPSLAKLITFRYSYGEGELVIRWGWLFRKVRNIPYARIQSLDAREMLLHRWTGTVAVKAETGGGTEIDGDIAAIPRAAFEEMRRRIVPRSVEAGDDPEAPVTPPAETLAHLSARELVLAGLINNRGMVVVAGLAAIVFEWGFGDRLLVGLFGSGVAEQGTFRTVLQLLQGSIALTPMALAVAILVVVGLVLAVRLLSLGLTILRFHDHHLKKIGEDLRVSCGLITRTTSTTPLRRIQTLTIREGPWHRLAGRVTLHAVTAGGSAFAEAVASRETLAPLLPKHRVDALVRVVLSGVTIPDIGWQSAAPASRRRVIFWNSIGWAVAAGAAWLIGPPAFVAVLVCAVLGIAAALGRLRRFGWNAFEGGMALRTGWLWRTTTIVRHDRIQLAILSESPIDRRHGMAVVSIDTAGFASPAIDLPWLMREDASRLVTRLDSCIATTEFAV
jgi:putative membrane protein